MVTATGIILGFILNFTSEFVKTDTKDNYTAYVVGICLLTGVVFLITVLNRALRMRYPKEKADAYYNITRQYFIFGISISFIGVAIKMVESFFS